MIGTMIETTIPRRADRAVAPVLQGYLRKVAAHPRHHCPDRCLDRRRSPDLSPQSPYDPSVENPPLMPEAPFIENPPAGTRATVTRWVFFPGIHPPQRAIVAGVPFLMVAVRAPVAGPDLGQRCLKLGCLWVVHA